jgi:hypothetical protein
MRPWRRPLKAWFSAVALALIPLSLAWHRLDDDRRADRNNGHTKVDFAGQYLLAYMLRTGHGHELYDRRAQRRVLAALYPVRDERPEQAQRDVDQLMDWFLGNDNANRRDQKSIGGPLYPPIQALYYVPLTLLPPSLAYRLNQILGLVWGAVAAIGIARSSGWRWPSALVFLLLMIFPGFIGSMNLGQNAALTLAIVVWGWVMAAEERPLVAGVLWGLLAFKPVWLVAFAIVPLWSRRWRMLAAMLATAGGLVLLTIPMVSWQTWLDWSAICREATDTYWWDENWIRHSHDLLSLPRQWLDFRNLPAARRNDALSLIIGWALVAAILEVTVWSAALRPEAARSRQGAGAAFLLLAAWLTCFHFMYYDALLAALPVMMLAQLPGRVVPRFMLAALSATIFLTPGGSGLQSLPYDTMWLAVLWCWCLRQIWRTGGPPRSITAMNIDQVVTPRSSSSLAPISRDRIKVSPMRTA